ncbi:MAG TPA: sulfur globule protein precursor [Pseudolabrys sp.]|nr:sulfur globule protein precursor [Pseudolabrys sp.]
MSKIVKWLAAGAFLVAVAALPSSASARWHHGWGWGGAGFGLGLGLGYAAAAPYYGGYYGGCWRVRRVFTPWGPRWRRVNVCY